MIVQFDADRAEYVGDEEDGVYYLVSEGADGWYMTAVVDCDSAGFVADLYTDEGPYETEDAALAAGKGAAIDWCINNQVNWEEEDNMSMEKRAVVNTDKEKTAHKKIEKQLTKKAEPKKAEPKDKK